MSDRDNQDDARPSRADVDDIADASLGVDTRIFRTIWDTFIRTPDVVAAAYAGDRDKYVPIIRFFLVLFGAQFAVMAFADLPTGMSLEALETSDQTRAAVAVWIETGRDCQIRLDGFEGDAEARAALLQECRDEVSLTMERVSSLTNAPLAFLSTIPFLILLKLYLWRRSLFGHLLAYLAATNSSYLVVLPFMAAAVIFPGYSLFWTGFGLSMIWYFIAIGRILYRFYSQNVWAVTLQILGQLAIIPIMFAIIAIAQLLVVHIALDAVHDLSIFHLMTLDPGANTESPTP